jgi:hypothetical protein
MMPSTSKAQHNLMAAVGHSPEFAKQTGIPQKVGMDFYNADKAKHLAQALRTPKKGKK